MARENIQKLLLEPNESSGSYESSSSEEDCK